MKNKLLSIFFNRVNSGIVLFLLFSLLSVKSWGQTTFFEFSGSSGYSAPPATGWTSAGSGVAGGSYLKLSPGSVTSPLYAASNNVIFTYNIASFGSGGNTNTKLTILNSSNGVISEHTLTATNSSSYTSNQTVNVGNIASPFKVRIEGLGTGTSGGNRGTRLQNYKLVGTAAPVTYTLTYDGNGNSAGTAPTAGSHASGTNNVTLPTTTMTRTGYLFNGWNRNAAGTSTNYNAGASFSMPASNTTLYARWSFTINYNNNGGTGSGSQTGYNDNSYTVNNGASFSRVGYTFGGWKTTSGDGGTADYAVGATYSHSGSSSTTTLYAHWISNGAILVATPSTLSGFNYIEGSGPSAVQTFTLTGVTLDGSDVEFLPGEGYEISIDNGLTWFDYDAPTTATLSSYTGNAVTVSVRLKTDLTAGTYNDVLLIDGGGDTDGTIVTLNGTVSPCVAPTAQSVLNAFTNVGTTDMTANFTADSGEGRIVIMNTINSFTDPTNSTTFPTANSDYAGSGEQVVYAGSGNTVAITGLNPSTTYWFRVYNYTICSGTYTYNTTAPTNNPRSQATLCDVPVTPNGELTPAENPACGSTTLVYEHGSGQPQAGVSYYWQSNASGTSTDNPVSSPLTVDATGDYYVRAYNGNCWSDALSIPMVVNIPINITSNLSTTPRSTCDGGTFTALSVSATGTGLGYQWYSNTAASIDTATSTAVGTNSNSFTPPGNVVGTLYYYVVVSGTAPCTAVTSNIVEHTVHPIPNTPETSQITGDRTGCGNVVLTKSDSDWYWQTSATGTATDPLNSATTYTASASGTVYVRAKNAFDCWSDALAIPIVVHIPVNITSNLSTTPRSICDGGTFTALSVSATGTGLSYQWYSNTANSADTATSTAVGTNSNSFTPPSNAVGTLYYYVVVSGTAPCTAVTSNILEHTVNPIPNTPETSQITGDRTGCGSVVLTKSDSDWYWQTSATGTATDPLNSATTYTASASGTVYVRAKNAFDCWGDALAIPIVVHTPVNITSNLSTTPRSICDGGTFTALSVSATGTGPSYQWYSNTANSADTATSTAVGTNSNSFTPPSNVLGTLYYYVVVSGTAPCAPVTSNILEHNVNPVGLITSIAPASGGPVGTLVTITGTGFTPGSTVKFGTVAATDVQIISLTEIQAVVPDGAVSNAIEVATALSCPAASTFTIINQDASGCN